MFRGSWFWETPFFVFYEAWRLREAQLVVFYVSGRFWEAQSVVFYDVFDNVRSEVVKKDVFIVPFDQKVQKYELFGLSCTKFYTWGIELLFLCGLLSRVFVVPKVDVKYI